MLKSKDDLLAECRTMIKDLQNGWPERELHTAPAKLLKEIDEAIGPQVVEPQRVYVLSWAPAYDQGATGGNEWRRSWRDLAELVCSFFSNPDDMENHDYRIVTLDLPGSWTTSDITEFLGGRGTEVIDPPDPRDDLADALSDWHEEQDE